MEVKDLHSENNTLMKDIKDTTNKLKETLKSQNEKINLVKISLLLKAIYRFKTIPIKMPLAFKFFFFFTELVLNILNFLWHDKRLQIEQVWRCHAA